MLICLKERFWEGFWKLYIKLPVVQVFETLALHNLRATSGPTYEFYEN